MELWDAYDVRGNSLEHTLIRGEEVPAGEYHLGAESYVRRYAGDKEAIPLQPGETVAYRWLTLPELLAFMNDPTFVATSRERWGVYLNTLKEAELK